MKFVDLYAQYLSLKSEIDDAIARVIEESSYIRGEHVWAFEENYRELMGVENCVSCANGTDAIFIALKSLGLQPGDEVITTAHSWISTSETITQAGGRVVFCDTEEDFFTIDPDQIEAKISPRTKGIIPVHLYGQPADMDRILAIARKHNLWVIEDCAQAHLASYKGCKVGTMGDVGTFSFYPGKNLGAMGDAGALVTNRRDVADFATLFARHGGKGDHVIEGINSRMDGIQAAVLNVKLRHLGEWTELRRSHSDTYRELLSEVEEVVLPAVRRDCTHVYHLFVLRVGNRDSFCGFLKDRGIPTSINYGSPLPFYKAYDYLGHREEEFPVAVRHAKEIVSLPMYPEMDRSVIEEVCRCVKMFFVRGR